MKLTKITWFDMFIYRVFYWRWNKILANRPDIRELAIAHLKAFDSISPDDNIKITVNIQPEETSNEQPR